MQYKKDRSMFKDLTSNQAICIRALENVTKLILKSQLENRDDIKREFDSVIKAFRDLGGYNPLDWNCRFTSQCWEELYTISTYKFKSDLTSSLATTISNAPVNELEALKFLEMEIKWTEAFENEPEAFLKDLECLLEKYPENVEFIYMKGHVYACSDDEDSRKKAIALYRVCFSKWRAEHGSIPHGSIKLCSGLELNYIETLIENEDFDGAEQACISFRKCGFYTSAEILNITGIMLSRIEDRKILNERLLMVAAESSKAIAKQADIQNRKSLEQLGLFSATITFIITAAIATLYNGDSQYGLYYLIAIGAILMAFVSTLCIFITKPIKPFYKDIRLFVLLIHSLVVISSIYASVMYINPNRTIVDEHLASLKDELRQVSESERKRSVHLYNQYLVKQNAMSKTLSKNEIEQLLETPRSEEQ